MEFVPCNFCHSTQAELFSTGGDRLHDTAGVFSLVRCLNCGLMYLSPRPTRQEIGKYYPNEYAAFGTSTLHEWFPPIGRWLWRRAMDRRCNQVLRFHSRGRLLDVGCSTGSFLTKMRDYAQWQPFGIEPDAEAAGCAREMLGADVFQGTVEEADYPDRHFTVVTLWDVFEHLHDPMGALRELNRILEQDGLLVLSIPNVHSLEAKCFGRHWAGYDIPRHLYAFPLPTLRSMLATEGFEVADVRCFEGGYLTAAVTLWELVRARVSNRLVRRLCHAILFLQGMRLLFLPVTWMVERLGKGSIVTVFAMKRRTQPRGGLGRDAE